MLQQCHVYVFVFLVAYIGSVNCLQCARCNSLTDPRCGTGLHLPMHECPPDTKNCLTYWAKIDGITEDRDVTVVRGCTELNIKTCETTGLRSPYVTSCFESCYTNGCNIKSKTELQNL